MSWKEAEGGLRRKGAHTPAVHTIFTQNREPLKDNSIVLDQIDPFESNGVLRFTRGGLHHRVSHTFHTFSLLYKEKVD